jgi:putative intracellular protease/amidase
LAAAAVAEAKAAKSASEASEPPVRVSYQIWPARSQAWPPRAAYEDGDAVVDGVLVSARAWPDHPGWMRAFVELLRKTAPPA